MRLANSSEHLEKSLDSRAEECECSPPQISVVVKVIVTDPALFRARRRGGGAAAFPGYTPEPNGAGRYTEQ